jgi:two-component system, sporulation sensor kinase D
MPNGGKLTISLEKSADSCLILVEDNGVGIPKEKLDQVFNPFFTMKKDGSGLGLTVCKRIIDTYGGNISIHSTIQHGTKVEITLPLSLEKNE